MPCIKFDKSLVVYISSKLNIVFGLVLYVPVNSYGHVGTVSSPYHTFFLGKLD